MNEVIKQEWISALLSDQYRQGIGRLRDDDDRFCCLGVLCNLHAMAHPHIAASQSTHYCYMGEEAILPLEVLKWAELPLSRPTVQIGTSSLALMNDTGFLFKDIAGEIERQL